MLRSFEVEVFYAPHIPIMLHVHAYILLCMCTCTVVHAYITAYQLILEQEP